MKVAFAEAFSGEDYKRTLETKLRNLKFTKDTNKNLSAAEHSRLDHTESLIEKLAVKVDSLLTTSKARAIVLIVVNLITRKIIVLN